MGWTPWGNKMALATANSVQLIDMDTGEARLCHNPWLNQAHTVEFSPDGKKLLVGSSGFDAVFEFDTASGEVVWQWFAWDHGFDRSKLGHYVVRSAARCRELAAMGHEVLLVEDPEKYKFGIPTRQKPAHLNSACYDSDGRILVTLFHQGAGYVVDRNTGKAQEVISGLSNPHKLSRRKRGGYFISDTRRGKVDFFGQKYRPNMRSPSPARRGLRDRHNYRSICRIQPSCGKTFSPASISIEALFGSLTSNVADIAA